MAARKSLVSSDKLAVETINDSSDNRTTYEAKNQNIDIENNKYEITPNNLEFWFFKNSNEVYLYHLFAEGLLRGAGTNLLNIVKEEADHLGANKIRLNSQHGSWGFYFKNGFLPELINVISAHSAFYIETKETRQIDQEMFLAMRESMGEKLNDRFRDKLKTMQKVYEQSIEILYKNFEGPEYSMHLVIDELKRKYWQMTPPPMAQPKIKGKNIPISMIMDLPYKGAQILKEENNGAFEDANIPNKKDTVEEIAEKFMLQKRE